MEQCQSCTNVRTFRSRSVCGFKKKHQFITFAFLLNGISVLACYLFTHIYIYIKHEFHMSERDKEREQSTKNIRSALHISTRV